MSHSALQRLILLALSLWLTSTAAKHNVTIDDTDPSIVYQGNWTSEPFYKSQSYNGSHHLSTDPNAKATFTFVGMIFPCKIWKRN